MRGLLVLLAFLFVVAMTTSIQANNSQHDAALQRKIAVALRAVHDAKALIDTDPTSAAQISLGAYLLHDSQATRDSLVATAAAVRTSLGTRASGVSTVLGADLVATSKRDQDITVLLKLSDGRGTEPPPLRGGYRPAIVSDDGTMIVTSDRRAVTWLWDVTDPARPELRATLRAGMLPVGLSPDASMLLTTDAVADPVDLELIDSPVTWRSGQTSRLWFFGGSGQPRQLVLPDAGADAVDFSQDGRLAVTVDVDASPPQALVWDLAAPTAQPPVDSIDLPGEAATVTARFLDNDRVLIADASTGVLSIRGVGVQAAPHELSTMSGPRQPFTRIAVSPDRRRIAAVGADSLLLWSSSTRTAPAKIMKIDGSGVSNLAFSRDGGALHIVVNDSTSENHTLIRRPFDVDAAIAVVCDPTVPRISKLDWEKYFIDMPYQPPCE